MGDGVLCLFFFGFFLVFSFSCFVHTDQESMLDTEVSINTDESFILDPEDLLPDEIPTSNEDEDNVDLEQKPPLR